MLQPYLAILMLLAVVGVNAVAIPLLSHFLGPRRPTAVKQAPYESGMPPLGSAHERFSVKFYVVAMLFILFDLETVFLFPWAAIFWGGGGEAGAGVGMGYLLVEMLIFLAVLFVGYVYVWKRGAFQWD